MIFAVLAVALAGAIVWCDRASLSLKPWSDSIPGDLRKAILLSEFLAHGFGAAMILTGIWVAAPKVRKRIWWAVAVVVLAGVAANLAKSAFGRQRPYEYLHQNGPGPATVTATEFQRQNGSERKSLNPGVDSWTGFLPVVFDRPRFDHPTQSFPSGHTATVFGLAFGLAWLCRRGQLFFLALACLAGFQRILVQAHWPSDVIAGVLVAYAISIAVFRFEAAIARPRRGQAG